MKSKSKISAVVPSVILGEITIEGDIYGEGALEIDGKVRGNIRSLSIITGVNSVVYGDITAERVEIHGEVFGNITAKKIICGSTAKVKGSIVHSTIHIENGAHIDGSCRKYVAPVYPPEALLENQDELVVVNAAAERQEEFELDKAVSGSELLYVKG